MLVELGLVEQRLAAVKEVLDGATVTDVTRRYGVARQTVHEWLRRYARHGLAGLIDGSRGRRRVRIRCHRRSRRGSSSYGARIPGWGPRTIGHRLAKEGVEPVSGRSSIYRCLVRHGLITPEARKRRRSDYRRWERSRAMELWQMDVVGGVRLADGSEAKIVSGIDDHSRFVVSARVVARATARPTCDALLAAIGRHGAPEQILTDNGNGKVFTGRYGPGSGQVLFDRICVDHGITHLLTAPRSPTTTGKIERWHKTLRREFLDGKVFASIADAQAQLDAWVGFYNRDRPHQSLGMAAPWERFRLADTVATTTTDAAPAPADASPPVVPSATRKVSAHGMVSFASTRYKAGRWLAGQTVDVTCAGGLVHIHHQGVLIATHARRHDPDQQAAGLRRKTTPAAPTPRPTASAASVTRKVDSSGAVSFAGSNYRVGNAYRRRQVQVAVVGDTMEISIGTRLIRTHQVKHDRTREHGALANPGGRPNRSNAA